MKNKVKVFSISALVVAMFFTFSTCSDGSDSGSVLEANIYITGKASIGETLSSNISEINGSGKISYQWERHNNVSITSVGQKIIPNGTGETYTVTEADIGKYLSVVISREGSSGTKRSSAVGPVGYSLDFIRALFNELGEQQKPLNTKINELFPTPNFGVSYNYSQSADIVVNGIRTGTAIISNYKKEYIRYSSASSAYGPNKEEYDYRFINFSCSSKLTILSGSGKYFLDSYYNDTKPNRYDRYLCTYDRMCDVIYSDTDTGITFSGVVTINYKDDLVPIYPGSSFTEFKRSIVVYLEDGAEYKLE